MLVILQASEGVVQVFFGGKIEKTVSRVEGNKRDYRNEMHFPSLLLCTAARSQVSAW